MINEKTAQRVLEAALETGGDFSEIFAEDTSKNMLQSINGKIENASYTRISGAGIRVLCGNRQGYAYTSDMSEESLIRTARAAAATLTGKPCHGTEPFVFREHAMPCKIPFSVIDNAKRIALITQAAKTAKDYSPEIAQVLIRFLDVQRNIEVFNSLGCHETDSQPRTRFMVNCVATQGTESEEGFFAPGYGMGFEMYDFIDPEFVAKQAARQAVTMLRADDCPAMRCPVVIDGGFGGVILHEACVHGLEATAVAKGNSVFCGKLGQKIASDCVTAIDDGTMPGEWGTVSVDDEGTPTQKNILIENGVLKSYLVDRLGARIMNHPLTGSSRRESYEYAPTSRMNNTFFAAGTDDEEEMIKQMGNGLFASHMGGGSVNPLTGDFCFAVSEGYLVKDGRIDRPVKGATLVGKGADVLMKIDRVGKKMWLEPGMCGSVSGYVNTTVGQPRIRVCELTVGGKGK